MTQLTAEEEHILKHTEALVWKVCEEVKESKDIERSFRRLDGLLNYVHKNDIEEYDFRYGRMREAIGEARDILGCKKWGREYVDKGY